MPLVYFHVYDGMLVAPDDEGLELANIEAAREEAVRGARSILSDEILRGCVDLSGRIEIAGEDGTILLALPFRDAFERARSIRLSIPADRPAATISDSCVGSPTVTSYSPPCTIHGSHQRGSHAL